MYTVIVPVLNEEGNINSLYRRLDPGFGELLFCDNGSSDQTLLMIAKLSERDSRVRVSQGSGTVADAIFRGIAEAQFGNVVVLDGDLSHPPELVKYLASHLKVYDFVSGSRYLGGSHTQDSLVNKFFSLGLNVLTFPLAPDMSDRSTGFFGVRRGLVRHPFRSYCKPALEVRVTCPIVSAKEIAYTFSHRVAGKSKLGRSKSIPITARDIGVLYLKKYRRMIKYALVGALGTSIYLGILALFTEVFGVWYIASALIGSGIAFFFNYTFNRLWTFNTKDFKCTDPDYEYQAWYSGSLIQKLWKRRIAGISLDVLAGCKRVLDLGCGSSPLLSRLPGKVTGIDCNAGKVAYQRTRCPESVELIVCDLSDGSVPSYPGEFDGVVCNNLLEHLEDPERVVTYAVESMKPGGRLVVTVPDSSLKATSLVERLYGKVMPGAYAHTHCFEFTQEALDRMCTSKGLSLVDRKHVFTDMVCIYRRDK